MKKITLSKNALVFVYFGFYILCLSSIQTWSQVSPIRILEHPAVDVPANSFVYEMAFSQDEQILVSAGLWLDIFVWDLNTGQLVRTLKGSEDYANAVAVSPDNKWIACGGGNNAYIWNAETGELIHTLHHATDPTKGIPCIAFSPDSQQLVTSILGKLFVLDVISGQIIRKFDFISGAYNGKCEFLPDGRRIFFSYCGGTIVDIMDGTNLLLILFGDSNTWHATLSSDYKYIYNLRNTNSGSYFNKYSVEAGELLNQIKYNANWGPIRKDGQYILTLQRQ